MLQLKKPVINLYRRIAVSFIVLNAILIIMVLYFSYAKATITIVPASERILSNFIINIKKNPEPFSQNEVEGEILSLELEGEKSFPSSSFKKVSLGTIGSVTIFNNYSKNQPLVATTRLLSPKGELFRIKNSIVVPAGGKTENVPVYADNPDKVQFPVSPSVFTIPGLWTGLQDKIYAQSEQPFETSGEVAVVGAEDIKRAQEEMKKILLEDGRAKLAKALGEANPSYTTEIVASEVLDESVPKEGTEALEFVYWMKIRLIGLGIAKDRLLSLARENLQQNLPSDKEIVGLEEGGFVYNVGKYDLESKEATVNVYLEGVMRLRVDSPVLAKEKFIGLKEEDVLSYLKELPAVREAEVEFSPFWISRVPRLVDHIEIIFKLED